MIRECPDCHGNGLRLVSHTRRESYAWEFPQVHLTIGSLVHTIQPEYEACELCKGVGKVEVRAAREGRTIDEQGYERRTRRVGTLTCRCGNRVPLTEETEEWTKASHVLASIKWRHKAYGTASGGCECGYAEMPDGRMVRLDLREKSAIKTRARTEFRTEFSKMHR